MGFKHFLLHFQHLIRVNLNSLLRQYVQEMSYTCKYTVGSKPSGSPGFLLAGSFFSLPNVQKKGEKCTQSVATSFGHFLISHQNL